MALRYKTKFRPFIYEYLFKFRCQVKNNKPRAKTWNWSSKFKNSNLQIKTLSFRQIDGNRLKHSQFQELINIHHWFLNCQ